MNDQILLLLALPIIVSGITAGVLYLCIRPETIKRSAGLTLVEALLTLAVAIGLPFFLLGEMHDPVRRAYPDGSDWFMIAAMCGAISMWQLVKYFRKERKPDHVFTRIIAFLAAILSLFLFLLGPMFLFRLAAGISMDDSGPKWEVWLLIVGGGLGSGAATLVFWGVLRLSGRFSDAEIDAMYRGTD